MEDLSEPPPAVLDEFFREIQAGYYFKGTLPLHDPKPKQIYLLSQTGLTKNGSDIDLASMKCTASH